MLTLLQATAFADRFLLALLAGPVSHALHVDDLRMGLLQGTAFVLPFVVATPLFGLVSDRLPRRVPILIGLALWTLAMAGAGLARSFNELLCARMLLGLGEAAIAPAALAQISAIGPGGRAGLATGVFAAGGPIGKGLALAAGGAALGWLTRHPGPLPPWREVLLLGGVLNLAVAAAAWTMLTGSAGARGRADALAAPAKTGGRWRLLSVASGGIAVVLISQTLANWAPTALARSFSLSAARSGALAGTPLLFAGPIIGLAGGWMLDRLGSRTARRLAPVLTAGGLALLGVFAVAFRAAPGVAAAQAALAGLAAVSGFTAVVGLRGVQLLSSPATRGRDAAAYVAAANLVAFGLGPPLVGWLAGRLGHGAGSLQDALTATLVGAAAAGVVVMGVLALLDRDRRGPRELAGV